MHGKNLSWHSYSIAVLALILVACGGGGEKSGADCKDGEIGCKCYNNKTCNGSLQCSPSLVCVQPGTAGAGGTSIGSLGGAAGASAAGGASGLDGSAGGATGFDGATADAPLGSGGINPGVDASSGGVPGTGGLPNTGGAPGMGGLTGNGGVQGTGGTPGTGGIPRLDAGAGGSAIDAGPDPVLGGACTAVGALGCVGHAQKGMMMCDGTKWVPNGACSGTLLCDTMPGPTQGTCVAPIANCASQQPGYSYCSSNTKVTCGPDLLTISGETCPYVCTGGQCTGECVPSSRDCDGQTPRSCATNATWLRGTTCTGDCNKGTCCATSTATNCNGTCVDLQTNNANCGGCGAICATTGGKSCRAGTCQCAVGMTDCSGTCVSLTASSANCGACGNACTNGKTCQSSLCACPTGTLECAGTCANVQTDKNNCGACGVTCGASTCYAGNCGGSNLITNGDFSDGSTHWQITKASTGVTYGMSGSSYCLSLPAYASAYFGWGDSVTSVPIAASYGYTFSYTVSSTDTLYSFQAKIGGTLSPYTEVYSTSSDVPPVTATTFTHSFTPTYSNTSAGIVFYMYAYSNGATVCFDDVSLVRH